MFQFMKRTRTLHVKELNRHFPKLLISLHIVLRKSEMVLSSNQALIIKKHLPHLLKIVEQPPFLTVAVFVVYLYHDTGHH